MKTLAFEFNDAAIAAAKPGEILATEAGVAIRAESGFASVELAHQVAVARRWARRHVARMESDGP
jgi:hypothetical protein